MSDWYDENDELLGEWVPCTEAEYEAIKFDDSVDWTVFASRTEVGIRVIDGIPLGQFKYRNRIFYTEWGARGAAYPLAACEDRWDGWGERLHTHMRFVPVAASLVPVGSSQGTGDPNA